jgi:bacteriocin biosynthesis cyclodehydratase domain-containing protein
LLQESPASSLSPIHSEIYLEKLEGIQFLSHFVPDAPGSWDRLCESRVGVVGAKSLKGPVETILVSMGIRQVAKFEVASLNRPKTFKPGALVNFLKGVDFLIACQDEPAFSFFETVNAVCLNARKPWLHLAIEGTKALLGPTFIPYQSACYVCYGKRLASNAPDLQTHLAYRRHLENELESGNEGEFLPLWTALAAQAAMEISRNLSGFAPPTTIGRIYEIPATSPVAVGHDVLRLPRCPACRPKRPPREAWDSTSPSTDNGNH